MSNVYKGYVTLTSVDDGAEGRPGEDGEDALYVIVESTAGNVFKNAGINTTLIAHVYYGSTEVTNSVSRWRWEKRFADGTVDASWSRASASTITLSSADVQDRATFFVYAEYSLT